MNKIYFILIILLSVIFTSCNREYIKMKAVLNNTVNPCGYVEFKQHEVITLGDEVAEQLKYYKSKLSWDKSFRDAYQEGIDNNSPFTQDKEKVELYSQEIDKDRIMIAYLESLDDNYPEIYNDISFITYKLSYMYVNDSGDKDLDICFGRFDRRHNLVAFKSNAQAKWMIFSDKVLIPDFDKFE